MQRVPNTPSSSDYQSTSVITSTSSTTGNLPPAIRIAENRDRIGNVRKEEESSEESTEEAPLSQNSQAEIHEEVGKQGQPQHIPQGSLPRYSEPGGCALSPGASSSSSTAHTGDAPNPTVEPSGAYRLRLEQWLESADGIPMDFRQQVKARIEKYLASPEKEAWTLDLSGLGLTTVPPLPSNFKKLDVRDNRLSALPERFPAGLQNLWVAGNQLSALPECLPAGLQTLDVYDNQLSALPEHLPAALQKLDVDNNQLSALPEHLPAGLQKLDVRSNQLSALPEHLPEGLQEINVKNNQLSALPDTLPAGLQELDVSYNQLSALPERLPAGLQKLFVSYNQLSALPEDLPAGLQELYVSNNQLGALPEHLPAGLQKLDVDNNQLSALPEHLPAGLQQLDVSHNQLSALPEHLPEGLQELCVSYNQLSALPEHLPAGLQMLDVIFNQLSALPEHLPARLRRLDVSDNELTSLPPGLLNLRGRVNLSNNPLSTAVLDHLRQITSAPDYHGPRILFSMASREAARTLDSVRPLTDAVRNWLGKQSTPWAGFAGEEGATEFSLFLDKLAQSIVGRDPAFRITFQSWLREMAVHPSLRAHVFTVARGATASCQDRVMLTANDMAKARLLFQVERGDHDQRLPELVDIARGMFRLEKLEAIARKKAESLRLVDEIEVYLAYQVKLRETLRLPLAVGEMAYFKVSGVGENDLLAAEASVKEQENREFRDFLLTWQPWLQALKRAGGPGEEAARARQFALWDAEYEQPLARLEEAIAAIDRQLSNGSASTTSGTGQTDVLEAERQRLSAQKNDLVSGARTLSDDIARRIASDGNARLPMSPSLLGPVWDIDGGYAANASEAVDTGVRAGST